MSAATRNDRRRERRVRKKMVERYLDWLLIANKSANAPARNSACEWLCEHEKLLRDVERVEIDRRLGIDSMPRGIDGRPS